MGDMGTLARDQIWEERRAREAREEKLAARREAAIARFGEPDRNGHVTRISDSSLHDEVCVLCGCTDAFPAMNQRCWPSADGNYCTPPLLSEDYPTEGPPAPEPRSPPAGAEPAPAPTPSAAALSDYLSSLELSVRATRVLSRMGVDSPERFLALTRREVLHQKGSGSRTWAEVSEVQTYIRAEGLRRAEAGQPSGLPPTEEGRAEREVILIKLRRLEMQGVVPCSRAQLAWLLHVANDEDQTVVAVLPETAEDPRVWVVLRRRIFS